MRLSDSARANNACGGVWLCDTKMDLFEEEELIDDTRAKLVDYEDDTVQQLDYGRDLVRSKVESDDEYYAGKPVSRGQLCSDFESGAR